MEENKKHLRDPKFWASVCAWMVPISIVVLWSVGIYCSWTKSEIATFIGAIAGPFAGLSGFFYIYANFLQQQELFERQSFESGLFRLLDQLKTDAIKVFPPDPKEGKTPLLKIFESKYNEAFVKEHLNSMSELSDSEKARKLNEIGHLYKASFGDSIRSVLALYKAFVGILTYMDQSKISNRENYFNLVFNQLTQAEIRAFFYGFFYEGFEFSTYEKSLIKFFFLRYNGRDLRFKKDIGLLED